MFRSSKDKVYDLTIEDTRNFMILGGLNVRDTFLIRFWG